MKYVDVCGTHSPVSQLVLGGPFGERSDTISFAILDQFVRQGGTAIETANSYADGAAEEQVGRWLSASGCRESVVLITKVCHPRAGESPNTARLVKELELSKSRLRVDTIDLVLLHRDPVSQSAHEVLSALELLRTQQSLSAYGICNINRKRLDAFAEAAVMKGIRGLSMLSNYYGLAVQARPPWPGVMQLGEAESEWARREDCPVLSWSSLAQGWFAYRNLPPEFQDVYQTSINEDRRERAQTLAQALGASPLQVALGFALAAPFRLLASVGPHSKAELDEILGSLAVTLTGKERQYLEGNSREWNNT